MLGRTRDWPGQQQIAIGLTSSGDDNGASHSFNQIVELKSKKSDATDPFTRGAVRYAKPTILKSQAIALLLQDVGQTRPTCGVAE